MAIGFTNAKSSIKPFGYIFVAYPAGSTVGIMDAATGERIDAEPKTGEYVFSVPYAGTWIVASFDGADFDSSANQAYETVTISAQSPYAMLELSYYLVLFDNGNQCAEVTGGWKVQNGSNANSAINSNNIYIGFINTNTSGGGHAAHTINKVALSGYNTLKATLNVTHLEGSNKIQFGIVGTANRTGNSFVANTSIGTTGEQTVSVDVSAYNNNSYYVIFEGLYTRATISKVWLE